MTQWTRRTWLAGAALAAPLLATACSQTQMLAAVDLLTPDSDSLREADAAFGPDPRQRLDLYAPRGAAGSPAVLFLFGGSWRQGNRASYRFVAEALVARGVVVGVADYRLAPAARHPDFAEDAALATRWMLDNVKPHGGDPASLTLLGHSAGSMNALQLALDPRHLARVGLARRDLAGVVALAPPTGQEVQRSRRLAPLFETADPPGSAWPYRLAGHGGAGAPPLLLVAGAEDFLIRAENVEALGHAVTAAGGGAETLVVPGAGHIGVLSDLWLGQARAEPWVGRLVRPGPGTARA
jgi:acetyl esterase/lipase